MPRYLTKQLAGHWHYQIAVPVQLQAAIGKRVICRYVPPCSGREAENRIIEWVAADKRRFAFLRTLPADLLQEIADAGGLDKYCTLARRLAQSVEAMTRMPDIIAELPADRLKRLRHHGAPFDALAGAAVRARQYGLSLQPQLEAAQGIAYKTATASVDRTLDGLVRLWEEKTHPTITRRHKTSVELLKEFLGDPDVRGITRDDIARWRDHLQPKGPVVVDHHLRKVRAVFSVAVDERKLTLNPAVGIKVWRPKKRAVEQAEERRKAFTGAQLSTILDKAKATPMRNKRRKADHLWALKLLIWSGRRLREICQLRRADIGTEDGVPYMWIRDAHPEQRLKPGTPARKIPLHPTVAADFLKYVANHDSAWAFPTYVHRKGDQGRAACLGEWFSDNRKGWGITDGKLTLHSIRHSFHDAMRNGKLHPDAQRVLVGHKGRDVHERVYGDGASLKVLAAELARVDPLA